MLTVSSTFSEPSVASSRRVVVVLGMHRSGTSLVAGCLQRLGVDFGPRLMPPDANNPRGYFEHNDVVNLHDRLLLALDRSWDDTTPFPDGWWQQADLLAPYRERMLGVLWRDFPAAPTWGLKDPRLCRLLPWWESLWPLVDSRPLFLLVRRAPAEVAASLARREGMSPAKAHLLWLRHTLEAEEATRPHERILLDFADLRRDEAAALLPVLRKLGLPDSLQTSSTPLVDPALGQTRISRGPENLPPLVREADAALRQGLLGAESAMRASLDQVAACTLHEFSFPKNPEEVARDLEQQLRAVRKQARWYEAEWRKAQGRVDKMAARLSRQESSVGGR